MSYSTVSTNQPKPLNVDGTPYVATVKFTYQNFFCMTKEGKETVYFFAANDLEAKTQAYNWAAQFTNSGGCASLDASIPKLTLKRTIDNTVVGNYQNFTVFSL